MEEKKRLTATKAAIAKFREEHPTFTDEYLAASVENTYPDLYLDNQEVAIEIIKELYRRQEDLTDESFVALLREMTEGRKLVRYGKEVIKTGQIMTKVRQLLDEIYHDAHEKTVFWSQYPLSQDPDVKQHFEELCKQKGRTLAQQLYAEFNNRALYEAGELSGFILPFHCYSELNGDVVFTKNKRTKEDYDGNGHSMVSEESVLYRTSNEANDSSKKGGCLGMMLFGLLLILIIGCNNVNNVGPFPEDKVACKENVDTILSHLKGWNVIDSVFTLDNFYSTTNKEGKRTEFHKYVLVVRVTDGLDTLTITADDSRTCFNMNTYKDEDAWSGSIFGLVLDFDKDINAIKRNNLALKRACGNDSCFELSTNSDKIMSAKFRKWKPKSPERPLDDYGLTKDDL